MTSPNPTQTFEKGGKNPHHRKEVHKNESWTYSIQTGIDGSYLQERTRELSETPKVESWQAKTLIHHSQEICKKWRQS